MTLEKYEKLCPLRRFIDNIDDKQKMTQYNDSVLLQEIKQSENQTLKVVGPMLIKNYDSLYACREFKDECCTYLNYSIDKEKDLYLKSKPDTEDSQWKLIEKLWNTLKLEKDDAIYCQRKSENESIDKIEKRINLMVYCKIRDYFKIMCDKTRGNTYQYYCSNLPKYVDKYYEIFKADNKCLNIENKKKDYSSYFSEDCNLYDMHKTFPQYDSSSGNLLESPNPRESICKYVNNVITQDSSEGTLAEFPEATSEESISSEAPLESLPYAGLTIVGFFSLFLFIYRYTTLGSSLRSPLTRKNKSTFIDAQIEQDSLDNTLEYKNHISENDDYTLSYQSLQN
ncbi:PIR Superfamily Protein [Plasmodium ovale curtisi]|uniref:PIR Superfamily Protein n=1 Tax=Plasmodium ovale curtisi TaxID=864141 RepID=A0A1A8WK17_PLAOA|nr:PIR Superfamily Protein [Plasmodium ovale curtisi]